MPKPRPGPVRRLVKAGQRALRGFGVDIKRYVPPVVDVSTADHVRQTLLSQHGIDLVIDVGANVGQYGSGLRGRGFRGRILSFEPISSVFGELQETAQNDSNWRCHRLGLGSNARQDTINVAGNNAESSSLLPMLDSHKQLAPESSYVRGETIDVRRLDEVTDPWLAEAKRMWLKIDVQGTEQQVIEGAAGVLDRVVVLEIELTIMPLYDGQPLIDEMIARLRSKGFRLVSLENVFSDPVAGYALQYAGTFIRDNANGGRPPADLDHHR